VQREKGIKDIDKFIEEKKVRLMQKDENYMASPLSSVYDLLLLQELDLKIREVNSQKIKNKGKFKRGGRKMKGVKAKDREKRLAGMENRSKSADMLLGGQLKVISKSFRKLNPKLMLKHEKKRHYSTGTASLYRRGSKANWNEKFRQFSREAC